MTADQIPERLAEFIQKYENMGQHAFKTGLILGCTLGPDQVWKALDICDKKEEIKESEG